MRIDYRWAAGDVDRILASLETVSPEGAFEPIEEGVDDGREPSVRPPCLRYLFR